MKIPVSTALVIMLSAGLVVGGSAESFAAATVGELAKPTGDHGARLSDDDLGAAVGASVDDVVDIACAIFAGGAASRKVAHWIARRAIFGICGVACLAGSVVIAAFCAIY